MIGWDSLGGGRGIIKRYQLCSNEQLQLDYPDFNEMSKIKNILMTKLWMHSLLSYWLNHEMGNDFIQYTTYQLCFYFVEGSLCTSSKTIEGPGIRYESNIKCQQIQSNYSTIY